MKRRMFIMLVSVAILFGSIFFFQAFKSFMVKRSMVTQARVVTVSAMVVQYSLWQPQIKATGSLRAIKGVNVTTELPGLVQTIYFKPGSFVEQGTLLVQLNVDSDIAQLNSLEAAAELAKTTYARDRAQYAIQAVSKATLDIDAADFKSKTAQVNQQIAIIAKKTIRAPFTGRLGISAVNPGQFVNSGDKVVPLQTLQPIYADFFVPQQSMIQLRNGQPVQLLVDVFPGQIFKGQITTIDPILDVNTRNVQAEATIDNPQFKLVPGMFATVKVRTGAPQPFLTLPQTAISFNPYGEIAYLVKQKGRDQKGKPILIAVQTLVTTGETRGDQIAVLKGLREGDLVVTSGQLKLKNGTQIEINNKIVPANNPTPDFKDE